MRHETVVTEVPLAELEKVLKERHKIRWAEKHPEAPASPAGLGAATGSTGDAEYVEPYPEDGWKELLDGYRKEGLTEDSAWSATCKCGWAANNPLPTKQAAEADAEAHLTAIYGREG